MRIIELSFQKNIRDLGGLKTKSGMKVKTNRLIRGGFLEQMTIQDLNVINSLKLTDVIDLRTAYEFVNCPEVRLPGVTYHNFPPLVDNVRVIDKKNSDGNLLWFVSGDKTGQEHMKQVYIDLVSSELSLTAYRNFFKLITSKDDGVFYFHCSQGKDRAGLAAYFIEIALGVSEEDARNDYLLSNVAMKKRIPHLIKLVENRPFFNEAYVEDLHAVFSTRDEYLDAALNFIKEKYGTTLNFLKKCLHVDIDLMRKIYLE